MRKILFLTALISFSVSTIFAQNNDSTAKKLNLNTKRYYHSIGFQVNDLLHQVLNFGNAFSSTIPYQIVYALQPVNSNYRLQLGLGYSKLKIADIDDRVSKGDTLSLRAGIVRRIPINKRFSAGIGADLLYDQGSVYSEAANGFENNDGSFDSTFTTTHSTLHQYGGGFQLNLSYQIANNLFIATELNYYIHFFTTKENILSERARNTSGTPGDITYSTSTFNDKIKGNQWVFTKPAALVLIFRF